MLDMSKYELKRQQEDKLENLKQSILEANNLSPEHYNIQDIIELPIEEFNDLLSRHPLTEEQLIMCRDIRRRGKNKVAAQNCRRRKSDQIEELRKRLESAEQQKETLRIKNERLNSIKRQEEEKLEDLKQSILFANNLSPEYYTIQVTEENNVEIVARECGEGERNTSSMVTEDDEVKNVGREYGEGETSTSSMESFELYQDEMADVKDRIFSILDGFNKFRDEDETEFMFS